MSLNLEKQLVIYGAYHNNTVNIAIHTIFVPLILFTAFTMACSSPTLIPLPHWLSVSLLPLNAGTIAAVLWGGYYVLLEPVAGTALAGICLGVAATGNYLMQNYDARTVIIYSLGVHIVSWILQFIGHGTFEGRRPALLDNLVQAIFLAPLFVWLELLFAFGYRPELQARVDVAVRKELTKLRDEKEKAGKNGKVQ